ncbi:cache domain-containing protein [Ammoniphilus sp. CFH 90114]|uniref:cache domain-containing protein n=1 Tax=Ammoniphilus sp. CFH 90114 TaxID=2493665 RepID=UPI00100E7C0C|nr:cache domain-containing protein [Ammoniphilus sp. CFH 90114]RXT07092.1 HAMP domain-containing protein [Ammoniphilus sp. CFH 90114]
MVRFVKGFYSIRFQLKVVVFIILLFSLTLTYVNAYLYAKQKVLDVGEEMFTNVLKDTVGFIDAMNQRVIAGDLTLKEAQDIVRDYALGPKGSDGSRDIQNSKMSTNNYMYVWASSPDGTMKMHPFDMEDKNYWDYQVEGKFTVRESWSNPEKTGYVFRELWKNPGEPVYTFIAFQAYYEPWDWIVGAGGREEIIYKERLQDLKIHFILSGCISLITGACAAHFFAEYLYRRFHEINLVMNQALKGDYTRTVEVRLKDEIGKLAENVNSMLSNVSKSMLPLSSIEERVSLNRKVQDDDDLMLYEAMNEGKQRTTQDNENITGVLEELIQTRVKVLESERRLQKQIHHNLFIVQEQERKKIAYELQNGTGQILYSMALAIKLMDSKSANIEMKEHLEGLNKMISESIIQVNELSFQLRPALLDDLGLLPAFRSLLHHIEKQYAIKTHISSSISEEGMGDEVKTVIYRIGHEMLTYYMKRTKLDFVMMTLSLDRQDYLLKIMLSGKELEAIYQEELKNKRIEFSSLEERVLILDGNLTITYDETLNLEVRLPLVSELG